jgi:hypothetical protein
MRRNFFSTSVCASRSELFCIICALRKNAAALVCFLTSSAQNHSSSVISNHKTFFTQELLQDLSGVLNTSHFQVHQQHI